MSRLKPRIPTALALGVHHQIACDSCGRVFEHGYQSVFKTAYAAVATAKECGWISLKSRPYDLCPDCRRGNKG